jgi:hypothetical protein
MQRMPPRDQHVSRVRRTMECVDPIATNVTLSRSSRVPFDWSVADHRSMRPAAGPFVPLVAMQAVAPSSCNRFPAALIAASRARVVVV